MKGKILLTLLMSFAIISFLHAQVPADQDTIYIDGGTLSGAENAGNMETIINGDIDGSNNRINPYRVYALYEGQVYYQLAPIDVNDPDGMLTIVGVPDPNNPSAKEKPIIIIYPTNGVDVTINNGAGVNQVYGSIKMVNVHYQVMQRDGFLTNELFFCGTTEGKGQRLIIDKCLFEFSNIDLFDCTNETGAIGGWPYGASFYITNSYFRNLFFNGQWWGSRVFQCKHPTDTTWVENCTFTTGGLTFLQQNQLTDFMYINHNTIVNNKKYWLLSPYRHEMYITNNIFVNQNWVGEDVVVTNSGQDPDGQFMSTIDIDTNNTTNHLIVNPRYMVGGDTNNIDPVLNLEKMKIFVSNNINFNDPALTSGYYESSTYTSDSLGGLPSYLDWGTGVPLPRKIDNVPGMWMNDRTKNLFTQYAPGAGADPGYGFVEENTLTDDPQTQTSVDLTPDVITQMAEWNQSQWADPRFSNLTGILSSAYIYGDYDPTTLPGIDNGTKTDNITTDGANIQVGITKFSDLTENFSQSTYMSQLDGEPIGSLIWDDAANASYDPAASLQAVLDRYKTVTDVKDISTGIPQVYSLKQNYPNPFNPSTEIEFSLPKSGNVTLKVFNLLGQEVTTLVNEFKNAGTYKADFNASGLASGLYIYKLEAGSFTIAKKMMLLK